MKHFRTLAVALMAICLPLSGRAQTATSPHPALVDQVIETLALSYKVTQLPASFKAQFKQNPFRLSQETSKQWLKAFNKAYNKEQLMHDYRTLLKNKLSQLSTDELTSWLSQPSTQKLAEARHKHHSLQGKRKQIVALYELEQNPPSKERQKLMGDFARAITPKNAMIEASITLFQSVLKTIDHVSAQLNFTDAQLNMIVNTFRKQGPKHIKQLREKGLPVKFHGIPSNTLEQALGFWQSQTGQALAKAIYTSLQQTYEKAGQRLSKAVNTNNQ